MYQHNEDIHNLIQCESLMSESSCPAPGRVPRSHRIPRARTAPNRPTDLGPDTARFLRKNQRTRAPPTIDRSEYQCALKEPRPPVPKTTAPNTERTAKNFIRDNVRAADGLEVKPRVPRAVISCRGECHDMSLLLEGRKLRESNSFGRVPKYLLSRRKAWEVEDKQMKEKAARMRQEEGVLPGYCPIPEEERERLLKGLKDRWMELHKEFQVLPVLCDTVPKVKRKLRLEKELAELEKDIELLETNPYIYLDKKSESFQGN